MEKRLDRFLMNENLANKLDTYRVWHVNSIISDHVPICLQIGLEDNIRKYHKSSTTNGSTILEYNVN